MAREPKKLDQLFRKILSALSKMAKAARDEELQAAFRKHHGETETHVSRMEQVFSVIDAPSWASSKKM
jgi:ferritin-like metal-binding protein YciE